MIRTFLCFFLFLPFFVFTQIPDLAGHWEGHIQTPQIKLDVKLDFEQPNKKTIKGTMDVPLQQLSGLEMTEVEWDSKKERLKFKVPAVPGNAAFNGKLRADGDSLVGSWIQSGLSMPMKMARPSAAAAAEMAATRAATLESFRLYVDSVLDAMDVAGASVALVHKGEVIMAEGFGLRNVEKELKADAETRFAIGSSSKAFTAFGLAVLAEEGKLEWDAPVREYMPDFKMYDRFATEQMTAIDLMTHRSGLPRHDFSWYGSGASREELYARLPYLEPSEAFRAAWQYQNFMFMTAGILAGRLDNSSWEQVTQSRILDPLGMEQTTLSIAGLQNSDNASLGYKWDDEDRAFTVMPYRNIDAIGPAGSINSNATDMAKWLQMLLDQGKYNDQQLLSKGNFRRLWTPYIPMGNQGMAGVISPMSYGLGWMVYHYRGHQAVEHGGNIDGFSANVFLLPNDDFGAVVLTNANGTPATSAIAYEAADRLLELGDTDWMKMLSGAGGATGDVKPETVDTKPVADTKPSRDLKGYTGTFYNPGYGEMQVKLVDKKLQLNYNNIDFDLAHWHYDVFKGEGPFGVEFLFNFRSDHDGYIAAVAVPLEPTLAPIEFEVQAPDYLSDAAFMERLTGTYDLKVLEAEVRLEGNKLIMEPTGQPAYELTPLRGTTYKIDFLDGYKVEFEIDPEGKDKASAIMAVQPRGSLRGERKK